MQMHGVVKRAQYSNGKVFPLAGDEFIPGGFMRTHECSVKCKKMKTPLAPRISTH
jgi:hypothetical protein